MTYDRVFRGRLEAFEAASSRIGLSVAQVLEDTELT